MSTPTKSAKKRSPKVSAHASKARRRLESRCERLAGAIERELRHMGAREVWERFARVARAMGVVES